MSYCRKGSHQLFSLSSFFLSFQYIITFCCLNSPLIVFQWNMMLLAYWMLHVYVLINLFRFCNSILLSMLFFFTFLRSILKYWCWNNVPFWAWRSVCFGWWRRGKENTVIHLIMQFLLYCQYSLCHKAYGDELPNIGMDDIGHFLKKKNVYIYILEWSCFPIWRTQSVNK